MEDFQKRMLDEHSELKDRLTKLNAALAKDGFRENRDIIDYKDSLEKFTFADGTPFGVKLE